MDYQCKLILDYLEKSFSGAKMMGDDEAMLRISRAIVAFELDIFKDCVIEEVDDER